MSWQLNIIEPSGEKRSIPIAFPATLGRGQTSSVVLRDPTLPQDAATIWPTGTLHFSKSPFWIKIHDACPAGKIGDLSVREAQIPTGVSFQIGETTLRIEPKMLKETQPEFPSGVRPWSTASESGRKVLWTAKKVSSTPLSVYIEGETGVGKEVLAQLVHAWSPRKSGSFVAINCGALPLALAESELFGHVKGAFTGASHHRSGALMQAHGGTLFLDEIGDLPLDIQVKLLRFLENGEIRAVGADHTSRADVRLICATHQPLQKLIAEGKFRRDLYYRIASVTLKVPPLRSRPEDIEMLAKKFSSDLTRSISPKAILRLQAHSWPGNVRELRHAIERACGFSHAFTTVLDEEAFEFLLTPENIIENPELELGLPILSLHEMERVVLIKALKLTQGNRAQAAKILGVARSTLFEMLKRHKIVGPRKRFVPGFPSH